MKKRWVTVLSLAVTISVLAGSLAFQAAASAADVTVLSDFDNTNTTAVMANGASSVNIYTAQADGIGYNNTKGARFQFGTGDNTGFINIWVNTASNNQNWSQAGYLQFWVSSPGSKTHIFLPSVIDSSNNQYFLDASAVVQIYQNGTWGSTPVVTDSVFNATAIEIAAGYTGPVRIALTSGDFANLTAAALQSVKAFAFYAYKPYYDATIQNANMLYMDNFALGSADDLDAYEPVASPVSSSQPTVTSSNSSAYTTGSNAALSTGQSYYLLTGCEDGQPALTKQLGNYSQFSVDTTSYAIGTKAAAVTFMNGSDQGYIGMTFAPAKTDWSDATYFQFYVDNTMDTNQNTPLELFYVNLDDNAATADGSGDIHFYDTAHKVWYNLTVSKSQVMTGGDGSKLKCFSIPAGVKGYVRIKLSANEFTGLTADTLKNVTKVSLFAVIPAVTGGPIAYFDDFGLVKGQGAYPSNIRDLSNYYAAAVSDATDSTSSTGGGTVTGDSNNYEDYGSGDTSIGQSYGETNADTGDQVGTGASLVILAGSLAAAVVLILKKQKVAR